MCLLLLLRADACVAVCVRRAAARTARGKSHGKWAALALVAAAACVGAVLFASQVDGPAAAVLQSCTPCTNGPNCIAGCMSMSMEGRHARMQELVETSRSAPQSVTRGGAHTSLHDQESAIQNRNEALLQMDKGHSEALGGVLDAAVKQVLRAEAAEVKLRRQAALSKGASVSSVYRGLRCVLPLGPSTHPEFSHAIHKHPSGSRPCFVGSVPPSRLAGPLSCVVRCVPVAESASAPLPRSLRVTSCCAHFLARSRGPTPKYNPFTMSQISPWSLFTLFVVRHSKCICDIDVDLMLDGFMFWCYIFFFLVNNFFPPILPDSPPQIVFEV